MKNLKQTFLNENKLEEPPLSCIIKGLTAIVQYFSKRTTPDRFKFEELGDTDEIHDTVILNSLKNCTSLKREEKSKPILLFMYHFH